MKLSEKFIKELEKYPESGMGYQYVSIELTNGYIINGLVVLNGEELIMPKDFLNQIKTIVVKKKERTNE